MGLSNGKPYEGKPYDAEMEGQRALERAKLQEDPLLSRVDRIARALERIADSLERVEVSSDGALCIHDLSRRE